MKATALIISLFFLGSLSWSQSRDKILTGSYQGYDGTAYSFMDDEEAYHMFESCTPEVLEEYDLNSDDFLDQLFTVTFKSIINATGETELQIVHLELVDPEYEEIEEE